MTYEQAVIAHSIGDVADRLWDRAFPADAGRATHEPSRVAPSRPSRVSVPNAGRGK